MMRRAIYRLGLLCSAGTLLACDALPVELHDRRSKEAPTAPAAHAPTWQCHGIWAGIEPREDPSDGYRLLAPRPGAPPLFTLTLVSPTVYEIRMPKGSESWRTRRKGRDERQGFTEAERVYLVPSSSEIECLGDIDAIWAALFSWITPDRLMTISKEFNEEILSADAQKQDVKTKMKELARTAVDKYQLTPERAEWLVYSMAKVKLDASRVQEERAQLESRTGPSAAPVADSVPPAAP